MTLVQLVLSDRPDHEGLNPGEPVGGVQGGELTGGVDHQHKPPPQRGVLGNLSPHPAHQSCTAQARKILVTFWRKHVLFVKFVQRRRCFAQEAEDLQDDLPGQVIHRGHGDPFLANQRAQLNHLHRLTTL